MAQSSESKPPIRLLFFWIGGLLGIFLLGGLIVMLMITNFLGSAGSYPVRDVEITITPGMPFNEIANELQRRGAISDARKFGFLARWDGQTDKIKSGRFLLNTGWTPRKVLDHLVNGLPILERVTIPEGLTWWETAAILEKAGLVRFDDFRDVISDPAFLRHWGIPFKNAEGYLFPDTYLLVRPAALNKETARVIANRLVDTFWRKAATLWSEGDVPQNRVKAMRNIVILASIIEKETGDPKERERISGVYNNRIERGMLLQADPTTIYGLGPSFEGRLRKSHLLDEANLYNTYKFPGLPPGPICSPGLACLRAAMKPESHQYLYFVSRNDGTHEFSENLADHNKAVQIYQKSK